MRSIRRDVSNVCLTAMCLIFHTSVLMRCLLRSIYRDPVVSESHVPVASFVNDSNDLPYLVGIHDYGLGSPGAVGGTSGAGSGCVGGGGGIGCGGGVSPG